VKRISRATVRRFAALVTSVIGALADRRVTPAEGAQIVLAAGAFIQSLRDDLDGPDDAGDA
jgi:hypothetical protein